MLHLYAEFKKVSRENTQRFTANHSNKIYVMMAVVIVTFLFGKFILGTILALPIFLVQSLVLFFRSQARDLNTLLNINYSQIID